MATAFTKVYKLLILYKRLYTYSIFDYKLIYFFLNKKIYFLPIVLKRV